MHGKAKQIKPLLFLCGLLYMALYYIAVSQEDLELPNSRICLVEIDIESGLDFLI